MQREGRNLHRIKMNHFDIFVQIEFRELFQKALQIRLANSIAAQKAKDGGAALLLREKRSFVLLQNGAQTTQWLAPFALLC